MTIVLVHGNPETAQVWDLMVDELVTAGFPEPVRLSPPGFGAPVPRDFPCTPLAYRDWLVEQLEAVPGPVDLVGHDWGGLHTVAAVMARGNLVRSWASDAIGVLAPGYEWHPLARIWQKQEDGEAWIGDQLALATDQRTEMYVTLGIDVRVAARLARGFDAAMGEAILRLYRGAAQPAMSRLGESLTTALDAPGLVIVAEQDDTVGTVSQRNAMAERAGATVRHLDAGHWWMTEHGGGAGAAALADFWATL